jgi:2-iminobutanoate/2-iminopropanoate deaminase
MSKLSLMIFVILSSALATPVLASPSILFFPAENGRPFSAAVRIGNSVYTSGMLGVAPDGTLPSDFSVQATNAMQAVADQLKLAGASMNDVYRCNVSLSDMKNIPSFNAVYLKYFKPDRLPVRMAIGVSGLARGAAVEVECDAYVQ